MTHFEPAIFPLQICVCVFSRPAYILSLLCRLEVAELQSQLELHRDTARPLVASPAPTPRTFDPDDPNLVSELQNMELNNMDLQVTDRECCQASSYLFFLLFLKLNLALHMFKIN